MTRARAYIAAMPEAIQGSGGSTATFNVARKLADFGLGEADIYDLLVDDYNPRCVPPWSERELRHKAAEGIRAERRPIENRPRTYPEREPMPHHASAADEPPPGRFDDDAPEPEPEPEPSSGARAAPPPSKDAPQPQPHTLPSIIDAWAAEGPLRRVPTGIEPLDRMSHGGLPVPWRVIIVGAPSAGKTAVSIIIADHLARMAAESGLVVGILGVDEEPEDLAIRLLQMAGYTLDEAEQREPKVLQAMQATVTGLRVRLYDDAWTIESAAADLAAWAKAEQRDGALFLDSLHAVQCEGEIRKSPREQVDANVRAMRCASTAHRLLVVASAEANRASYRDEDAAQRTNDLAAGAESRAVEFGAQTQLMLRTPKGHPDVIHVRVAKNRRADRGEFWLGLDRARHALTECEDPLAEGSEDAEERRQASVRAGVLRDAESLAALLVRHADGLGVRELRGALKAAGHRWGQPRLDAARSALRAGHKGVRLVEIDGGRGKPLLARLERIES